MEKYKNPGSKHECPECGHQGCFVRYIDNERKITFPEYVGRCDRECHCGYHFTPKMYFEKHPEVSHKPFNQPETATIQKVQSRPASYIPVHIMQQSLAWYEANNLYLFMAEKIGREKAKILSDEYKIGAGKHWNGATVFWQVDIGGNVRTGKVMLYDRQTGHRVKQPFNHVTWAHTLMGIKDFNLHQCLFGEHLLNTDKDKTVAIVESEKTAVIASAFIPQYLWLATGGKNGCFNESAMAVLWHRNVVLFPDLGATEDWKKKVDILRKLHVYVSVFDFLETVATGEDIANGLDIADYLLREKSFDEEKERDPPSTDKPDARKYRNEECHRCRFSHEGINGTYCGKWGRYVEYGKGDCKEAVPSL